MMKPPKVGATAMEFFEKKFSLRNAKNVIVLHTPEVSLIAIFLVNIFSRALVAFRAC